MEHTTESMERESADPAVFRQKFSSAPVKMENFLSDTLTVYI
jgi:hypothetical protein